MKISTFLLVYICTLVPAYSQSNATTKTDPQPPTKLSLQEVMNKIPGTNGERYALGMKHGTMRVLVYAPKGKDDQSPHNQDEVYLVVSGKGEFECGKEIVLFEPNDLLYVPAGVSHRFVNFTDDLVLWVVFYGVAGGEK
jgi:mannose-6-phosphate isomerase-like protein (cupin superfamily)